MYSSLSGVTVQSRVIGPDIRRWSSADVVEDRGEARRFKVAAMHRTINEFTAAGVLSDRGRVLLSALVEATHPDKVRRCGPEGRQHAVLRVEVSKGRMAKVAGWSPIDEGGINEADDEAKAKLVAGVRKVGRVLNELAAAGLVSRQRVNGGRSITIVELFASPAAGGAANAGGTSAAGGTFEAAAAPVEAGGTPVAGGTFTGGTFEAAGGTFVSQPVGHLCPDRWDIFVPPLSSAFTLPHSPSASVVVVEPPKPPQAGEREAPPAPTAAKPIAEPPAPTDEYRDERLNELAGAGVTGKTLTELANRRLLPKSIAAVVAKAKRSRRVENIAGLVVALVRELEDDWAADEAPPRRMVAKASTPAEINALGRKFRALWSSVDGVAELVDTTDPDIAKFFNVAAIRAAVVEAFLGAHPRFRNMTDKPTTDRLEFQRWFVAGMEADRDWIESIAWIRDVRNRLFDIERDDSACCSDDDWDRIEFVIEAAENAGELSRGPKGEKLRDALNRAESSDRFIAWCVYNVEELENAMRQFRPPNADKLVAAAPIDPNAKPIASYPGVLNELVRSVEAFMVAGVPEHQREAVGRIAAAEFALGHNGTTPDCTDPEYLRFVVNHAGSIANGHRAARQRLWYAAFVEADNVGKVRSPELNELICKHTSSDDIIAAWCQSGLFALRTKDGSVNLVKDTKQAEHNAAERGKLIAERIAAEFKADELVVVGNDNGSTE